ncbi:hypothetical protein CDCA_CDCA19G4629 [Cyanidium caldarium]|uniref:Uncharacterized protein n=1 Tax=Cyanidium caldarium TaxID=2771 RepID=A0AAV9J291_CYACA|nr:hypothetical protein CDCA_CDCA19G4629 [Cyanidium caldarium]
MSQQPADMMALGLALHEAPVKWAHVRQAWHRQWQALQWDATSLWLWTLLSQAYPQVRTWNADRSTNASRRCRRWSSVGGEVEWAQHLLHESGCRVEHLVVAIEQALHLGVSVSLIADCLATCAGHASFTQFGDIASRIHDLDLRATVYRRIICRYAIGPRSAAANVLAALEFHSACRDDKFLALVVRDWDGARRREFDAVVRMAMANTQRFLGLLRASHASHRAEFPAYRE